MMFIKKTSAVNGFTLLEMLVSLAIFAMLGLATYTVVNTTVNGHEAVLNQNTQLTNLQRAFVIMENDLTQLTQRKVRINGEEANDSFFHVSDYLFESESIGFAFVRDGWTNPAMVLPRSELQLVAYRLVERRLERLYFNFVDNEMGTEPKVQVLINDIESMTLSYFIDQAWTEELAQGELPLAIKLSLETDTFGLIERNFLIIKKTEVVKAT
ncbi:MAG: general secretion pathway protein J [Psychrosphaera sp.]|jgi:general secretion pathway protein J|uniref:Type II secretion system minor pseudopilin GspJ n=1 Tax=Psychrosphaera aquimarina TaxID=2044854 RepID=A0ABU3QYE6_9GAMM|nr:MULTISPECIES: type II secretion system minor pseudopilin GspJ [Psychrosphaera]MBU2918174.1 type II secretion system minor pseudopilin GspJ [Psychrosphaera sp. F3M07]MDU0112461.1 type II secretion system minor pseudopilin GspJ [Psychrosphaera aquimarina]